MTLISACGDENSGNTLKPWDGLSVEAQQVIVALADSGNTSIGQFNSAEKIKSIHFGYEFYDGKSPAHEHKGMQVSSLDNIKNGVISVCVKDGIVNQWLIGHVGGTDILKEYEKGDSVAWAPLEKKNFEMGKKCYIGALVAGENVEISVPEVMKKKSGRKTNQKYWLLYVIFDNTEPEK